MEMEMVDDDGGWWMEMEMVDDDGGWWMEIVDGDGG